MDLSQIVQIINNLPVNIYLLLAIIGLIEGFKAIDKNGKLKKIYFIFPFALGALASIATGGLASVFQFILYWMLYSGLPILLYEAVIKVLKALVAKLTKPQT